MLHNPRKVGTTDLVPLLALLCESSLAHAVSVGCRVDPHTAPQREDGEIRRGAELISLCYFARNQDELG